MNHLAEVSYEYGTSYSTSTTTLDPAASAVLSLVWVAVALVLIVSAWKIFTKAGRPGWAAIVPLYNTYTLLQINGRPGWWILLFFIPFVNFIVAIIIGLDLAKAFGKSTTFAIFGLILFPIVGFPMLAFGSATYNGGKPTNLGATPPAPQPAVAPAASTPPTPPTPPATPPTA